MENVSDKIVIYEKLLCTSHICWDFWIICLFLAALSSAIWGLQAGAIKTEFCQQI